MPSNYSLSPAIAPIGWMQPLDRTVQLVDCPPGGASPSELPLELEEKAPGDTIDYAIDLTRWLVDEGDDIAALLAPTISPAISATDLGIVWTTIIGSMPTILTSGGVGGQKYTIDLQALTVSGRRKAILLSLYVNGETADTPPVAAAAFPPNAIANEDGSIVLSDDGITLIAS